MRVRIKQKPPVSQVDGISLDRFQVGQEYEVGNLVAALMLAEDWAELPPWQAPPTLNASEFYDLRIPRLPDPSNLIRERFPPSLDRLARAAERSRRVARPRPQRPSKKRH